jgi:hypothetical protein
MKAPSQDPGLRAAAREPELLTLMLRDNPMLSVG